MDHTPLFGKFLNVCMSIHLSFHLSIIKLECVQETYKFTSHFSPILLLCSAINAIILLHNRCILNKCNQGVSCSVFIFTPLLTFTTCMTSMKQEKLSHNSICMTSYKLELFLGHNSYQCSHTYKLLKCKILTTTFFHLRP